MSESPTRTPGRTDPPDSWQRLTKVGLVLAVIAVALPLLSIVNAPRISMNDESTHIDYVWRLSHFELPTLGQDLSAATLERWSCRGQANVPQLPGCGSETPADGYPAHGQQYNAFHPPLYYGVTALGARTIVAVTGVDFVTAARSTGVLWLFAAMFGMYLTLRYWRVPWEYALVSAAALPTIPPILHASSTVTNDAPAALAGVAALFVLGRVVVHRQFGWILPALVAAGVTLTKTINAIPILAVGAVVVFIAAVQYRREGPRPARPLVAVGASLILTPLVVHLTWFGSQLSRQPSDWVSPVTGQNTTPVDGLPFDEWVPTLFGGLQMGRNYYLDPSVRSPYLAAWASVATLLLAAACFVGLAIFRRYSVRWFLVITTLVAAAAYPLLVQAQSYMGDRSYFRLVTSRYGIAVIPLGIALLGVIAARQQLRRTAVALLVVGLSATFSGAARLTPSCGSDNQPLLCPEGVAAGSDPDPLFRPVADGRRPLPAVPGSHDSG